MPLRDHFRPPVENKHSWDELHGMWPAVIVQQLFPILPEGYVAAPRVHLGTACEIDVSTYERDKPAHLERPRDGNGGVAVAAWAPPKPTLTVETELPDQDEYEVRVYDAREFRDCSIVTGADSKIARQEQGESTWDPLNASELAPSSANGLIPSLIAWAKSQPPGNDAIVSTFRSMLPPPPR